MTAATDIPRCPFCGRGPHPRDHCSCNTVKPDSAEIMIDDLTPYWVMRCVHGNACVRTPSMLLPELAR